VPSRATRSTPRRRRSLEAILALASLVLSLALAEWALRSYQAAHARPAVHGGEGLVELHEVGELRRPNALGVYKGQVHRTNAYGFRGREPSRAKPPGVFRIVVIGDSITMGEGVGDEETYPAQLERSLRASGGDRFEVLNLGLSGLNLRQSLDYRLPTGLELEPDMLIYGFTVNDLEGLPSYRTTYVRTAAATPWRLLSLARVALNATRERFGLEGSYRAELEENYFRNRAVWFEFDSDLRRLALEAKHREICAEVLLHAQLFDDRARLDPIFARVERAALDVGLHVTSSVPDFEGLDVESMWIEWGDPHPNAEGHRLLARALVRGLAALPATCWKGGRPALAPQAAGADALSSPPASSPRSPSGSR
jgi:lysophospholipase L1-like esterase